MDADVPVDADALAESDAPVDADAPADPATPADPDAPERRTRPGGAVLSSVGVALVVLVGLGTLASSPTTAFVSSAPVSQPSVLSERVTGGIGIPRSTPDTAAAGAAAYEAAVAASAAQLAPAVDEPVKDLRPRVVAQVDALQVRLPSVAAMASGFHEAATANALPMRPYGTLLRNLNETRYDAPPDAADGATYLVMSSRGRTAPANSALDVMMRDDDPVLSPVDGIVADVREIRVEQRHRDLRIELRPDDVDDLRVVIVHVDDVRVAPGDRVEAGVTVLADTARRFPFLSQIDNITYPELWPHVHLEVQPRDAPRPGGTDAAIDDR